MIIPVKTFIKHPVFKKVSETAGELDMEAYVVGGYVRDALLDRPCKDIDFMVVGDGILFAEKLAEKIAFKGEIAVHKNFGTAGFTMFGFDLEFVGARKESYRKHSRNPQVSPGSMKDDLQRRDFTINALAIALHPRNYGEFVDLFDGLNDLENRVLKTPLNPDSTYSDDPLRMLRAIRFSAQLGFKIEGVSFDAISKNAARIEIVAKERIADELNKMILSPNPSLAFKLLLNSGLLHYIFPEMVALHGVDNVEGKGHKDNFYHTLQVLENVASVSDDLWIRWAAIMHDIAKPPTKKFDPETGWTFHGHEELGARMTPKIFKKLGLPLNHHMKFVQKLVRLHLRPIALVKEGISDSAIRRLIFEAGDDLEHLLILCKADITSKNELKVKKYKDNYDRLTHKLKEIEEKDRVRNFQPPISGEDIMKAYQIEPCHEIGLIKNAIKDAILDGKINNDRKEAIEYMRAKGLEMGLVIKNELM